MRRPDPLSESQILRLGAGLTGAVLLASAALAADLAREHMAAIGEICGAASHPHCPWCYVAVGLAVAGLAAIAAAIRPQAATGILGLLEIKAGRRAR